MILRNQPSKLLHGIKENNPFPRYQNDYKIDAILSIKETVALGRKVLMKKLAAVTVTVAAG